ncbi:hypothetical protein HYQ44_009496 [Verticillium longisporum]|nr:hypothetical protein HYQ44_009496 [Verticillium longisporum]
MPSRGRRGGQARYMATGRECHTNRSYLQLSMVCTASWTRAAISGGRSKSVGLLGKALAEFRVIPSLYSVIIAP